MGNFIPRYTGLNIDIFEADKKSLVKEARRLAGFVKRRYNKLDKYNVPDTKERRLLDFEYSRMTGSGDTTKVSSFWSEKKLRKIISQYDKYLSSGHGSLEELVEEGSIYAEKAGLEDADLATIASLANDIRESVRNIAEMYDSEYIKEFYAEVKRQNLDIRDVYYKLHVAYKESKDSHDLPKLQVLEDIIGRGLR